MKKLVWFAMAAVVLSIFNACQKSDELIDQSIDAQQQEAVKPDVYSENGYLVFKNIEAVDSIIQMLSKMTTLEIEAWEKSMNVISARSEFEQLFSEYENLSSYEEFLSFKSRNFEKLKFNNSDTEDNSINYPYATIHFLPVLNNKGLVKIGPSLIKYTKENQILVKNGDINALSNLQENIDNNNVIISTTLKSTTVDDFVVDNFPDYDPLGRQNEPWHMVSGVSKRRMINELVYENYRTYLGYYSNGYHYELGFYVYFQQRCHKKTWTGWNSYTTKYYFDDLKFKVGSDPTIKYDPYTHITSPDRKTGRVRLAKYYITTTLYGQNPTPPSLLDQRDLSLSVKTSCQGFDISRAYYIEYAEHSGFSSAPGNPWPSTSTPTYE
ncbi:hypothetical protein [uncultured Draconibacterium sp.]|uniref:hypothetical protein n=1 Tax=uncultured Draconibacterium sp. TaxID=1573823 RepID=UPI003216DC76